MASSLPSFSTILTVLLVSSVTFIVLDVSFGCFVLEQPFEKTATFRYLNHVGLAPYVRNAIDGISNSQVYKKHILPNLNSFVRTVKPHIQEIRRQTTIYYNHVAIYFKENFTVLLNYIERKIIPTLQQHWSHFSAFSKHYISMIVAKSNELALVIAEWFSKNVATKIPKEELMQTFAGFVESFQKTMVNSYEYVADHIRKIIA